MLKNKILSALLAASMLLMASCAGEENAHTNVANAALIAPDEVNYQTVDVKISDYVKTAQGGGTLFYPVTTELKWETENSRIVELHVGREAAVKAGDVLATFIVETSASELENLRIKLQRTEEAFEEGKKERMKEIRHVERNLDYHFSREKKIAALELESLQIDYDMYVYEQERAIADILEDIAEIENSVTENALIAPFDGIVDSVWNCYPGDKIDPGTVVVEMHSTDRFLVAVSDSADKLRYNQNVTVEAGRKNERKSYHGRVITAPNVLPEDYRWVALIEVDEQVTAEDLKYSINFHADTEKVNDVIVLERSVVNQESGKHYVNILEDDLVKKRFITVGSHNIQEYWVLDGLEEGQSLVLN